MKNIKKWKIPLIVLVAWFAFNEIGNMYVEQSMVVNRLPVLGNANVENKESLLADSSELPILSVKSAQSKTTDAEINEHLFTVASTVQNELIQAQTQIIETTVDYTHDASEYILSSLIIDAVTHDGVIVNGRFRKRGDVLGASYTAPTGEVFVAKLISVKGQTLSFNINGKKVARRYDF
ncbi:hypothetical protein [Vibrio rotiferianus]|uniref:hypothetical protein n=1 Tax=Vibrio rotiferianus TaxID=190895 RepID=UPI0012E09DD3|nr:hypothetical protein [Vibrio rotiferianus]